MTVESSRVLMMGENLCPPQCQPIVYMNLVSLGLVKANWYCLLENVPYKGLVLISS